MDVPIKSAESQLEPGPYEYPINDEYDDEQHDCYTERQLFADKEQSSIESGELLNMVMNNNGYYSCDIGFELQVVDLCCLVRLDFLQEFYVYDHQHEAYERLKRDYNGKITL